jgi:hypothetical protein
MKRINQMDEQTLSFTFIVDLDIKIQQKNITKIPLIGGSTV